MRSFELLKERFGDLKFMTTAELHSFAKDLTDFKKKFMKSDKSNQYFNELSEIYRIGGKLEELLKSRSQ